MLLWCKALTKNEKLDEKQVDEVLWNFSQIFHFTYCKTLTKTNVVHNSQLSQTFFSKQSFHTKYLALDLQRKGASTFFIASCFQSKFSTENMWIW